MNKIQEIQATPEYKIVREVLNRLKAQKGDVVSLMLCKSLLNSYCLSSDILMHKDTLPISFRHFAAYVSEPENQGVYSHEAALALLIQDFLTKAAAIAANFCKAEDIARQISREL